MGKRYLLAVPPDKEEFVVTHLDNPLDSGSRTLGLQKKAACASTYVQQGYRLVLRGNPRRTADRALKDSSRLDCAKKGDLTADPYHPRLQKG